MRLDIPASSKGAYSPHGMLCHDDMTLFHHNGDSVTNRHGDRVTKGALIAPEIATMRLGIPASSVGANGPYGMMCREDMTLCSHQGKRTMMRQAMTPDRIAISQFGIPASSIRANGPNGMGHVNMTPMSQKGNCLVQGKISPCQPSSCHIGMTGSPGRCPANYKPHPEVATFHTGSEPIEKIDGSAPKYSRIEAPSRGLGD